MNIINSKPWDSKYLKPTDEKYYSNRREVLKKMGIAAGGLITAPLLESGLLQDRDFNFSGMNDYYPANLNANYVLDRPETKEYDATHYNNFYEFISREDPNIYNVYKFVDKFSTSDWRFKVSGLANRTGYYFLEEMIKEFGLEERTYRHRCVERWSMAVPWTGFPLKKLVEYFDPKSEAKYLTMTTYSDPTAMPGVRNLSHYPWPYTEGLRIDEAMNELAFIATGLYGKPIPKQNGAPMRLVVPWKYGYKNIKSIAAFEFSKDQPKTFWNQVAPDEYPFLSNIDPEIPHPRWSQKVEKMIPDGEERPTLKYNGYGEFVATMYS